jgi:chorismate mutase-like protein
VNQQLTLAQLRQQIDELDQQLLQLFSQRAQYAQQVAQVKAGHQAQQIAYYRPQREAQILQNIMQTNPGPLPAEVVARLFLEVISACRALEQVLHIVFLGDQGSLAQKALYKHFGHSITSAGMEKVDSLLEAIVCQDAHYGVLPVHCLTDWLANNELGYFAEGHLQLCGEIQLTADELHKAIAVHYVVVGREQLTPSGLDKTSLLISTDNNDKGLLHRILGLFNQQQLNLTHIENRFLAKAEQSRCLFFIDVEGHASDTPLQQVQTELVNGGFHCQVLGAYPKAIL